MKTVLRKIARFSLILFIPTMLTTMTSCQEDVDHPTVIKKGKIKPSPGEN